MSERMKVLCPMERQGKTYWMRIGSAFKNADESINVYLDAYPANGKLRICAMNLDLEDGEVKP